MKTSWKTRGRVMWFLLRAASWLSIVIVLLPTPDSMKLPESNVGAAQAVSASLGNGVRHASVLRASAGSLRGRIGGAHPVRSQGASERQTSAKWVYEFLSAKLGPQHSAVVKSEPKATPADLDNSQNTLTPSDAAPAWRGPQRQAEAKR